MFGPRQVGELTVGNALAGDATLSAFISSATDKEVGVYSVDGTAVAAGTAFKLYQKTAGDAAKNLNYEFSDSIHPKYVERVTLAEYAAETAKSEKVDGFAVSGTIAAQRTYEVEIRVENQLSPENFEQIVGYYVTGEILGSDTAVTVRDGIIASLNKNLTKRGNSEFTVVADGDGILVTEKLQNNVPGKIPGRKLLFTTSGRVFNNIGNGINSNLGLLTTTLVSAGSYGNGTGKFATNFEYFVKGYTYDANRLFAYPVDFGDRTPQYTSKTGTYNVIQIVHYMPRTETSVERQYKVSTILVEKSDLASNVNTNDILTKIRTAVGSFATVPANLAVV